jgi:hypothetical protein
MGLPTIADTYRVAFNWSCPTAGLTAENVMHFRKASSSPVAIATMIDGRVTSSMWGVESDTCSVASLDVTPLDGSGASYEFSTGSPAKWKGANAAAEFTPQAAAIVKLTTSLRGRSYRGRIFLPWVSEPSAQNGRLISGALTPLQAAWTAFVANIITDGGELVVASYKLSTAQAVANAHCETFLATQRRRMQRTSV